MIKLFSLTYVLGATFVIAALGVAYAPLTREPLPLVGSERGALVAVAVLGMIACAIGGVSQAAGGLVNPSNGLGWTHPMIILGSVLGAAALLILGAGLLGWDGVLQSIAPLVPGTTGPEVRAAHVATFALAVLIGLKWLIATAVAVFAQAS